MFFLTSARGQQEIIFHNGVRRISGSAPGFQYFTSPNGRFVLALAQMGPPPNVNGQGEIRAEMAKTVETFSQGAAVHRMWVRTIKGGVNRLERSDVHVSDQGDYFVVAEELGRAISVYKKDFERTFLADLGHRSYFESFPELLFQIDERNGERLLAYWERDENTWYARKIDDASKVTVTPEQVARWNEATRQSILGKLEVERRAATALEFPKLPKRITRLLAEKMPANTNDSVREIHMEFLTLLRNPADHDWLEYLFNRRVSETFPFPIRRDLFVYADAYSPDRLYTDRLLAVWDNRVPQAHEGFNGTMQREWKHFNIGEISGKVRLSVPYDSETSKGGSFNLHLMSERSPGSLKENEPTEVVENRIAFPPMAVRAAPSLEVPFRYRTVLPGTYRLKAVWDKRPHFTDTQNAGPGDYESELSAPIVITPGGTVSNLVIQCTNRVAGGEAYYAADEFRVKAAAH